MLLCTTVVYKCMPHRYSNFLFRSDLPLPRNGCFFTPQRLIFVVLCVAAVCFSSRCDLCTNACTLFLVPVLFRTCFAAQRLLFLLNGYYSWHRDCLLYKQPLCYFAQPLCANECTTVILHIRGRYGVYEPRGFVVDMFFTTGSGFVVRINKAGESRCTCLFEVENHRPCAHIIATMMATNGYNFWDSRWFGKSWHCSTYRMQYLRPVRGIAMQTYQWHETNLIPAQLTLVPGHSMIHS